MNLKEAFRFQNKLQRLMDEGEGILNREKNVTKVETTYFRKKGHERGGGRNRPRSSGN